MIRRKQQGFTLVETVVVLAIIGILTVAITNGAGQNTKNERFSAQVREFTNILREAQTKSYTTQTGAPTGCTNASGSLVAPCYWRGTAVEFRTNSAVYATQLLYGRDLSQFAQVSPNGSCTTSDQQLCIEGKQLSRSQDLGGLELQSIAMAGVSPNPTSATIAFLSPDGRAYTRSSILDNADPSNRFNPTQKLYSGQGLVTFVLKDAAVPKLTATVTFDPAAGTINSSVQ